MEASFWDGKRAPGIADTVEVTKYDSVVEVIEQAFKKYADRPAFTSIGHTMTYKQIDEYSAAFASYLQNHTSQQLNPPHQQEQLELYGYKTMD